jgi:hypothetical protein
MTKVLRSYNGTGTPNMARSCRTGKNARAPKNPVEMPGLIPQISQKARKSAYARLRPLTPACWRYFFCGRAVRFTARGYANWKWEGTKRTHGTKGREGTEELPNLPLCSGFFRLLPASSAFFRLLPGYPPSENSFNGWREGRLGLRFGVSKWRTLGRGVRFGSVCSVLARFTERVFSREDGF